MKRREERKRERIIPVRVNTQVWEERFQTFKVESREPEKRKWFCCREREADRCSFAFVDAKRSVSITCSCSVLCVDRRR